MKWRSDKPLYVNKFKVKQPKPFFRGLIDKLNARLHYVPPEERVPAHVNMVLQAPPVELKNLLVAALFAKKSLDSTRHVDIPFPEKLMASEEPVAEPLREMLRTYVAALEKFQIELSEGETPVAAAAARGMTTWIISLYTLILPGKEQLGLDMWKKLVSVDGDLEDAYRFLLRRDPTDVERSCLTYRPKRFLR